MKEWRKFSRRDFLKAAATSAAAAAIPGSLLRSPSTKFLSTRADAARRYQSNPVTVRFQTDWRTFTQPQEFFDALIERFEAANPDIKIEWIQTPATTEDVLTNIAGGNAPDCIHSHTNSLATIAVLAPKGYLIPLTDLIASSDISFDDYLPEQWDYVKWNDTVYGLPVTEGGPMPAMCYHKQFFEDNGFDPSRGPASWDEVAEIGLKLTTFDENGAISRLGFEPTNNFASWAPGWGIFSNQAYISPDKKTMTFNTPRWAEILNWTANFYNAIGIDKVNSFWTRWDRFTNSERSAFTNGAEGMEATGYFTPADMVRNARLLPGPDWQIGYDWMPTFGEATKAVYMGSHQLMMLTSTQIPEQTFRWMSYVLSLEANLLEFEMRGGFMWSKPLAAAIDVSAFPGLDFFMNMPLDADRIWSGAEWTSPISGSIEQRWARAQQEVTYGRKTAEEALADINEELQRDLDQANAANA